MVTSFTYTRCKIIPSFTNDPAKLFLFVEDASFTPGSCPQNDLLFHNTNPAELPPFSHRYLAKLPPHLPRPVWFDCLWPIGPLKLPPFAMRQNCRHVHTEVRSNNPFFTTDWSHWRCWTASCCWASHACTLRGPTWRANCLRSLTPRLRRPQPRPPTTKLTTLRPRRPQVIHDFTATFTQRSYKVTSSFTQKSYNVTATLIQRPWKIPYFPV